MAYSQPDDLVPLSKFSGIINYENNLILQKVKDMAIYFLVGFSIRIFKEIVISAVEFLVTCLVSEILNTNDTSRQPSSRFILMTSQAG